MNDIENIQIIEPPNLTWSVTLCDGYTVLFPDKYKKPNAFYRLMQRLVFGFIYLDISGEKNG